MTDIMLDNVTQDFSMHRDFIYFFGSHGGHVEVHRRTSCTLGVKVV